MRAPFGLYLLPLVALAFLPGTAEAGMPSITLSDLAKLRLQTISFFLCGFLLCAGLIQLLWNYLRKDFTSLPRLSYGKAVGLTALWGLAFLLVLTMISGARELMTPGAWERRDWTYELVKGKPPPPLPEDTAEAVRRVQLDRLRVELWRYARSNQGRFPAELAALTLPAEATRVPGPSGLPYVYLGGLKIDDRRPVVYEPEAFGPRRLVLMADGEVRSLEWAEIASLLPAEKGP